jgi:hypothetical protein
VFFWKLKYGYIQIIWLEPVYYKFGKEFCMNHKIKKTMMILAFFVFYINYHGFARGGKQPDPPQNSASDTTNDLLRSIDQKITDINKEITKTNGEITKTNGEITKINGEIDKLREINPQYIPGDAYMKDILPVDTYPADGNKIPVIPQIIEYLLNHNGKYDDLKFYLSIPLTLKISEQNEIAEVEIINNMVILNSPYLTSDKITEFTTDSEGILVEIHGPAKDKGRVLKILFKEQGRILEFTRKANGYELSSVVINDKKNYDINPSELVQLFVSGKNNRKSEVRPVSINIENYDTKPHAPSYQNINAGYRVDSYITSMPSRYIIDRGSLRHEGVIKLVEKRKRSALSKNDFAVISEYFKEAEYEGVNVDIAIAQMLFVTDYLRNKQSISSHNYAGLRNIPPKFTGSFSSMTIGVRAHIQHLKAYANETPRRQIVDPRYKLAFERGFYGMNFDQLYKRWSDKPYYGPSIDKILCDLYEY